MHLRVVRCADVSWIHSNTAVVATEYHAPATYLSYLLPVSTRQVPCPQIRTAILKGFKGECDLKWLDTQSKSAYKASLLLLIQPQYEYNNNVLLLWCTYSTLIQGVYLVPAAPYRVRAFILVKWAIRLIMYQVCTTYMGLIFRQRRCQIPGT